MGGIQGDRKGIRALEWQPCGERSIVDPAAPGKLRAIGNEGHKPVGVELGPQCDLIRHGFDPSPERLEVDRIEDIFEDIGERLRQEVRSGPPQNPPTLSGQSNGY